MNTNQKYVSIGKWVSTHGLKGDLVLRHGLGEKVTLTGLGAIFVRDITGGWLPWFVENTRVKNETEIFVKLEGIDSKEAGRPLLQKEAWLKQEDFDEYADKSAVIKLLGFTIVEKGKPLGTVEEVIEQPHQILCRIDMDGKEVFIPLHEQTLLKTDQRKKLIYVSLPEGLLDIYLKG